ncbi:hypothetical protein MHYP_G00182240 [Metynnis hypsauchen]
MLVMTKARRELSPVSLLRAAGFPEERSRSCCAPDWLLAAGCWLRPRSSTPSCCRDPHEERFRPAAPTRRPLPLDHRFVSLIKSSPKTSNGALKRAVRCVKPAFV